MASFRLLPILAPALAWGLVSSADAASLPPHAPLRILVVGDAVNPNNLPPDQLTEPADIRAALADPQNGLNLDGGDSAVVLVDSQCVDQALDLLGDENLDAVVYFAHRSARACNNSDAQPALTAAFADFLAGGGGIVVFHHGIYEANGKGEVLQLLGGTASSIEWNTNVGQRVIGTAPGHFVVDNGVTYDETVAYDDAANGVSPGMYGSFVNLPDERYPQLSLLKAPGESRTILFASDYNGGKHVLGYDLQRQGWAGRVVFLQPGEYQPLILDIDGDPFQILANALVYASGALEDPGDTTSTTDGTTGGTDGTSSGTDGTSSGTDGTSSGTDATTGGSSDATTGGSSDATTGGTNGTGSTSSDGTAGTSEGSGGESSGPGSGGTDDPTAGSSASGSSGSATGDEADDASGCACSVEDPGPARSRPWASSASRR
ncbi:MAG: hypothetical protein R3B09_04445 [Nannocystaceae bacterium]